MWREQRIWSWCPAVASEFVLDDRVGCYRLLVVMAPLFPQGYALCYGRRGHAGQVESTGPRLGRHERDAY